VSDIVQSNPVASLPPRAFRLRPYNGRVVARLRRAAVLSLVLTLGLGTGGCAVGPLGSMFGSDRDESAAYAKSDVTGSIASRASATSANLPSESDLGYTRAAVAEVLSRGGNTTSAPWENPRTGARGTVTPLAAAYTQDGVTCRDFLASYVHGGAESWLQGEACRKTKGPWEVKSLRPWQRS
jgi:surface antigen